MRMTAPPARLAALLASTVMAAGMLFTVGLAAPSARAADAGTNVALASAGATVTASGQELAGQWGPEEAIDGVDNPGATGAAQSRWSSDHSDDAWITVKLAEPTVIDHVTILWEAACAARYKLQVSTDGTHFTDATGVISPVCGARDVEKLTTVDASQPYRYVRMQSIKRTPIGGQYYGVSLYEFQVWDGPEPAPTVDRAADLVPKPAHETEHNDQAPFVLGPDARIVDDQGTATSAEFLAARLRTSTGYALPVVTGAAKKGDVVFTSGTVAGEDSDEAYSLVADAANVTITSPTEHGAFDAVQTLEQLLPPFVGSSTVVDTVWDVPAVEITDAPRFRYRGIMLDVARSFLTVGEVEHVIDTMADYKMSVLHLHLTDDQGWRIQITNDGKAKDDPIDYSLLTKVSGATGMTQEGYENELGRTGYYTQDQYKALVAYAAARHIEVIPEIDAPAHSNAALHAIPQLNTAHSAPAADENGTTPANGTGDVGYSSLDANAPITWTFMTHVLTQLAAMTPGDYIDVGGDESAATSAADYTKFVTTTVKIVHDLGKKSMGWNETAVAGLDAGDALQYWTGGTAATLKAVEDDGAKLVISNGSSAYLDQKYSSTTPIGLTWAGGGDFPKYYDWNPASVVKDGGADLPDSDLLGVEGPMWSETIRGGSQAEFMLFPRAISIAEIGWTPQADRDVADFTTRLAAQGPRMLVDGANFYDSPQAPWQWAMTGDEVAAAPGHSVTLSVGTLAAPGTTASDDGGHIAVDSTADADGISASSIDGDLSATIDWGDGSAATDAVFRTDTARTSLSAGGLYSLRGTHDYAAAGTYTGTITASDGTTASFTATVAAGTPDPSGPAPWDPSAHTPKLTVAPTVAAGGRLSGELSGYEPGSYVTFTVGTTAIGTVRPGADGTADLSLPIDPGTYAGDYTVTAAAGSRTADATVHVTSDLVPLKDPIDQKKLSVVAVDSQETDQEQAPGSNAIDGNPSTYWHTHWSGGDAPGYGTAGHWIILDLGGEYDVSGISYLQRAGNVNGEMKDYDVYVTDSADVATDPDQDTADWGAPAASGSFTGVTSHPQVVEFDTAKTGRYVKLVGHDSISGNAYGGAAEINVGGTPHTAAAPTPKVTLSASTVAAGGSLSLTASGFPANATVSVTLHSSPVVLATSVTTDADGSLATTVTVPSDTAPGAHSVVVTQTGTSGQAASASADLTVTAADSGSGPGTGDGGSGSTGSGSGGGTSGGTTGGTSGGTSGGGSGGGSAGTTSGGGTSGGASGGGTSAGTASGGDGSATGAAASGGTGTGTGSTATGGTGTASGVNGTATRDHADARSGDLAATGIPVGLGLLLALLLAGAGTVLVAARRRTRPAGTGSVTADGDISDLFTSEDNA